MVVFGSSLLPVRLRPLIFPKTHGGGGRRGCLLSFITYDIYMYTDGVQIGTEVGMCINSE